MAHVPVLPRSRADLLETAERRWAAVSAARPDLEPAVQLQRRLISLVLDLSVTIDGGRLPRLSLPAKYIAAKLARGVPALTGEPVPLPVAALTPAVLRLCDALAEGGAGDSARHIRDAIETGAVAPVSLFTASLARDQTAIRTGAS